MSEMEMLKELRRIIAIVAGQDLTAERVTGTIAHRWTSIARPTRTWAWSRCLAQQWSRWVDVTVVVGPT